MVSEEVRLSFEKSEMLVLGRWKNITITKDDTLIMNGYGYKNLIEEQV